MAPRRRRWLAIIGLLSLLLGAKVAQGLAQPKAIQRYTTRVAIAEIDTNVEAAVRQAVAWAGGLGSVVAPGDLVVVKPNLVMDAAGGSGMVTDPAVARAVVRLALEAGAGAVLIAEGTAQYSQGDANRDRFCTAAAFRAAGYDLDGDMVDDATGVPLVDLNDSGGTDVVDPAKVSRVVVPAGLIRQEYWLPNLILQADVLISVPVLKNHYLAGVTAGMKNLVGLLPNDIYHGAGNIYGKHSLNHDPIGLDQHIVDLNLARRPDFVVVDGQRGMVDGPVGWTLTDPPMRIILAGFDVVAVDTVTTLAMGYDPLAIPYLQLGAQSGLGVANTSYIDVVGKPLAQVRRQFPAPYAGSPARRCDLHPPAVAITGPPEGEWSGSVLVVVQASDNDALARVELTVDGQEVGRLLSPPYEFVLDTTAYAPGTHTVRAVAVDRSLNCTEGARDVVFIPTVAPTAPLRDTSTPLPATVAPVPTAPAATPASTSSPAASPAATPPAPVPTTSVPNPTVLTLLTRSPAPGETTKPQVGPSSTPGLEPTGEAAGSDPGTTPTPPAVAEAPLATAALVDPIAGPESGGGAEDQGLRPGSAIVALIALAAVILWVVIASIRQRRKMGPSE